MRNAPPSSSRISSWFSSTRPRDAERPPLELEDQLLVLQHPSVLVAEDGEKDLVREMALHRLPVDVEELGVGGAGAVFQHVVPPAISALGDSHVVGHDV